MEKKEDVVILFMEKEPNVIGLEKLNSFKLKN